MTPVPPDMLKAEIRRNARCQCGSGLKHKKCHGSDVIREEAKQIATLMVFKRITEAQGRARIIDRAECGRLISMVNTKMIEMILGPEEPNELTAQTLEESEKGDDSHTEDIEEEESEIAVPETKDVKELRIGLNRCSGCGAVVYGECRKCKGDQHEGQQGCQVGTRV